MTEEKNPGDDAPTTPYRLSGAAAVSPPAAPVPVDTSPPIVLSQAPAINSGAAKPVVDKPTTIVAAPSREKK